MTMICSLCGKAGIRWMGPLSNLTHTECPHCGGMNCQEPESQPDEDEEIMTSTPTPTLDLDALQRTYKRRLRNTTTWLEFQEAAKEAFPHLIALSREAKKLARASESEQVGGEIKALMRECGKITDALERTKKRFSVNQVWPLLTALHTLIAKCRELQEENERLNGELFLKKDKIMCQEQWLEQDKQKLAAAQERIRELEGAKS